MSTTASERTFVQASLARGQWFCGLTPALQERILDAAVLHHFAPGRAIQEQDRIPPASGSSCRARYS